MISSIFTTEGIFLSCLTNSIAAVVLKFDISTVHKTISVMILTSSVFDQCYVKHHTVMLFG